MAKNTNIPQQTRTKERKRDEKRADREKGPERSAKMRFETAARVKIEQTESRA